MTNTNNNTNKNEQVKQAINDAVLSANLSNIEILNACKNLAADVVLTFNLF